MNISVINTTNFWLKVLGLTATYAFFAALVINFFSSNGVVSIVWPCSGIALASLLMWGYSYWPGILIGAWLGNLLAGSSPVVSLLIACGNTLEALTGYWLLCRNPSFHIDLKYPKNYLILGAVGILSASMSAAIGTSTLWWSAVIPKESIVINLINWWQGDFLGIILITPLILVWRHPPYDWLNSRRMPEAIACFGLAWLFGQIIFLGWFKDLLGPMLGFWMFLFFVWSAERFGRHGALLMMSITTTQSLLGIIKHVGFFGEVVTDTGLINFWCYTLVLSVVGMTLALITYESNQNKETLQLSEDKLRKLFVMSPIGMARNAMDGRYIEVNDALLSMLGYSLEELNQLTYWDITPIEYEHQEQQQLKLLHDTQRYGPYEKEYIHKDGHHVAVRLNGAFVMSHGEQFIWSIIEDISERKKTEEAMQLATMVFENANEAMMITDAENIILAINPAFSKLTGYSSKEIIGKTPNIRHSGYHNETFYQKMWAEIINTGCWQGEIWNRHKSGEIRAEWLTINTIYNPDQSAHRRVALFYDITEKKAADDLIWQQAHFDSLTGLPNRRMFYDRFEVEIKNVDCKNSSLALLFLDLDRFKEINDSLGHSVGDQLLKLVTLRLKECLRETDTLARLGGDEFTIILSELDDLRVIDVITQRILNALQKPFELGDQLIHISGSIGIVCYPENSSNIEGLLSCADQAMYHAKKQGRNGYSFFNQCMQEASKNRIKLINDLHKAINEQQFHVVYQPIVNLATKQIGKAEALIRWHHPLMGQISPSHFIPLAEETGLIIKIGQWVFRQAAEQVKSWRTRYNPSFQISVNKSPIQFQDKNVHYETWSAQLKSLDLPGQSIVVEITEGLLMDNDEQINQKLLCFRDHSIPVALDDFGTGYSSLSYLKKFHIDYLKIDQAFVRNIVLNSDDIALCEAIIVMAHKLGIKVIAEGIETEQQRELLTTMGCDYGQGYLFSKPVPPEEFEKLLLNNYF